MKTVELFAGTQGLKGNMERSVIPKELFYEIFAKCVSNDNCTLNEQEKKA